MRGCCFFFFTLFLYLLCVCTDISLRKCMSNVLVLKTMSNDLNGFLKLITTTLA